MTDAEVIFACWFFVMSAGLIFVSLLYWGIRLICWMRERRRQRFRLAADPMCWRWPR